jgi:hypothetical protein
MPQTHIWAMVYTGRSRVVYIGRLRVAHIGRLRVAHIGRLRVAHIGRLRVAHIMRLWVAHTMRSRMDHYSPVNDTVYTACTATVVQQWCNSGATVVVDSSPLSAPSAIPPSPKHKAASCKNKMAAFCQLE